MLNFISRLIDSEDPVIVTPYGGYANDDRIYAQARVLEDEGLDRHRDDTVLGNIFRSYKRFETDEKENVAVVAKWAGGSRELISDEEGYIWLDAPINIPEKETGNIWLPLTYSLTMKGQEVFHARTEILKPSVDADYGIISDMDETVIHTGLDSFMRWKVLVSTMATQSSERSPLEGAQEFYRRLSKGRSGDGNNPFFYLSNSPWNLHDYLTEFLKAHDFPKGPLLLRDIGLEHRKKRTLIEGNKYIKVNHILHTYPNLKFVLIGDGEDLDPEIYLEIARVFPKQVIAIYIRAVSNKKKLRRIEKLIEGSLDVEIKLITHTQEAILHAENKGLLVKKSSLP